MSGSLDLILENRDKNNSIFLKWKINLQVVLITATGLQG